MPLSFRVIIADHLVSAKASTPEEARLGAKKLCASAVASSAVASSAQQRGCHARRSAGGRWGALRGRCGVGSRPTSSESAVQCMGDERLAGGEAQRTFIRRTSLRYDEQKQEQGDLLLFLKIARGGYNTRTHEFRIRQQKTLTTMVRRLVLTALVAASQALSAPRPYAEIADIAESSMKTDASTRTDISMRSDAMIIIPNEYQTPTNHTPHPNDELHLCSDCLLYTSPSPRD